MPIGIIGVRLRVRNLILFSLLLLSACSKKTGAIHLIWSNDQATGISVPKTMLKTDSLEQRMVVRLVKNGDPVDMFGNYKVEPDEIIFEPLVPFTRGLHYQVLIDGQMAEEIAIPPADPTRAPRLLAIYPTTDTVPENLLKIYLRFSKPMSEGQSVHYLTLLKSNGDTIDGAFLDLQPELWSADRTMLTAWFDPGRIKRDLRPNKLYGPPLRKGELYALMISDRWKDVEGSPLAPDFSKKFIVVSRDSLSPDPNKWAIQNPKSGTTSALMIDLKSSLDYSLLNTTLHVVDGNGNPVIGQWYIGSLERTASFTPEQKWEPGNYQLQIETRLEDLAGNNLNRVFDVDLRAKANRPESSVISVPFSTKN